MRRFVSGVGAWIEDRTGFPSAISHFLSEDIPKSAGWPQVFGSVALFLFLIQSLTGIVLALDFAPATGEAYTSVQYIIHAVAGGRVMRGLHHWGASMMIVVVFLHMAQVFIFGAYKKPREATWIAGVILLLLTLAFGLTGYLLPWDNRAYWGTMVTVKILAGLPVIGPFLTGLLGATDELGVITFSRFYALHMVVLPGATVLLTIIHVYLVRRHGIAPGESQTGEVQRFFPKQLFRDLCAVLVTFACLFAAAAFLDAPLERMADPTDTTYVPRPEWYFLFLFQLLKVFPGGLEVIGTLVLPSLAVLVLLLLPFLRRTQKRLVTRRAPAVSIVVAAFGIWTALTSAAVWPLSSSRSARVPGDAKEPPTKPQLVRGARVFAISGCAGCHKVNGMGGTIGPSLNGLARRRSETWVRSHFTSPGRFSPGTVMPPYQFSDNDERDLILYLFSLNN